MNSESYQGYFTSFKQCSGRARLYVHLSPWLWSLDFLFQVSYKQSFRLDFAKVLHLSLPVFNRVLGVVPSFLFGGSILKQHSGEEIFILHLEVEGPGMCQV